MIGDSLSGDCWVGIGKLGDSQEILPRSGEKGRALEAKVVNRKKTEGVMGSHHTFCFWVLWGYPQMPSR
jgi:hypothetical protein